MQLQDNGGSSGGTGSMISESGNIPVTGDIGVSEGINIERV